jgi:hypothetical protein
MNTNPIKPKLIAHRINTVAQLEQTSPYLGIEIDLRSKGSKIILHHEPFCGGEDFELWLDYYHHGTIILNVKEEGLEKTVIKLLSGRGIKNYFFLDVSFPFLVKLSNEGMNQIAVRFSEFESLETVLNMQGRVKYVWVDCFTKLPLNRQIYCMLKTAGFEVCLVSPELLRPEEAEIEIYAGILRKEHIDVDMICTKRPELWERLI